MRAKPLRWAIDSQLRQKMEREIKEEDERLLREAIDHCAELRAEELIDNGLASYAGEY